MKKLSIYFLSYLSLYVTFCHPMTTPVSRFDTFQERMAELYVHASSKVSNNAPVIMFSGICLATALLSVRYACTMTGNFKKKIEYQEGQIRSLAQQVADLNTGLSHLATQKDTAQIERQVAAVQQTVDINHRIVFGRLQALSQRVQDTTAKLDNLGQQVDEIHRVAQKTDRFMDAICEGVKRDGQQVEAAALVPAAAVPGDGAGHAQRSWGILSIVSLLSKAPFNF